MSKYSENIPPSIIGAVGWFLDDIPAGAKVLDIGCSTGYYGAYIKEHKRASVYGVEMSEDCHAAAKVLDGVYSFDLDQAWPKNVYERKYDVVFMGDVIEHLKDPGLAIKRAYNLLAKDGRLFISTPNVAHLSVRLELLGGGFEYESMGILDNTHLKYFTYATLTNLVQEAGYDIVRIDSSESDYPREVTEKILKKYGLSPTKKFWDMIARPEARSFQYKLVLKSRSKNAKTPARIPRQVEKPEQYKADYIDDLRRTIENSNKELEVLRGVRMDLEKENAKIGSTLESVLNSKAYRVATKAQKLRSAVSGRRKNGE